jgi:hypothetical protein
MNRPKRMLLVLALVVAVCALSLPTPADELTPADLKRWQEEFMVVVKQGEKLFHSSKPLNPANGVFLRRI